MDLDGGSRLRANMRNLRAVKKKDRGETKPSDGNLRLDCQASSSKSRGKIRCGTKLNIRQSNHFSTTVGR